MWLAEGWTNQGSASGKELNLRLGVHIGRTTCVSTQTLNFFPTARAIQNFQYKPSRPFYATSGRDWSPLSAEWVSATGCDWHRFLLSGQENRERSAPCFRSRRTILYHELGWAIPSRISPPHWSALKLNLVLILGTLILASVSRYGLEPLELSTTIWLDPSTISSTKCFPIALVAEELLVHDEWSSSR